MNTSKPATDAYDNLIANINSRRQSWRHAFLQSMLESLWFWGAIGLIGFDAAIWVWG